MASITTAIGLLSLLTSNLTPVRQFGGYSAAGCLVALGMVLYALPALLHLSRPRPPKASQLNPRRWHALGAVLCRYPGVIAGGCAVFFVAASLGLIWFRTETKVVRYFPDESQLVQDYRYLEDNLAHIAPIETVIRFTPEAQQRLRFLERMEVIRAIEDQIRQHPEISGTLSLADFQPVREAPGEDASVRQKIFYNRRSSEAERRIKEEQEGGSAQFLAVSRPHADVGVDNAMLSADGHELWRITAQAAVMSDADYGELTRELDERIRAVLRYHAGCRSRRHRCRAAVPPDAAGGAEQSGDQFRPGVRDYRRGDDCGAPQSARRGTEHAAEPLPGRCRVRSAFLVGTADGHRDDDYGVGRAGDCR